MYFSSKKDSKFDWFTFAVSNKNLALFCYPGASKKSQNNVEQWFSDNQKN